MMLFKLGEKIKVMKPTMTWKTTVQVSDTTKMPQRTKAGYIK